MSLATTETCDILVIGGGIAGASAAAALVPRRKLALLERESDCGYHATGRSAASFTQNYGTRTIRRLVKCSRAFYEDPPRGFAEHPLLAPRGILTIAREDQRADLEQEWRRACEFVPDMRHMSRDELRAMVPALRAEYAGAAILEPGARDVDVHSVHQGFLRQAKACGAAVRTDAEVTRLERDGKMWHATTRAGRFAAPIVVNAAGAWCDVVAGMAGVRPIGLVPKRRTAFTVDLPADVDARSWPLVNDVGGEFYFKPDAGRLFVSPADETPSEPTDAQPEDIDVAMGVDRLMRATTIEVRHIARKWAGLRSFVADGSPVCGYDGKVPGFFWLAGQGGYGIKTAPALSRATAALIDGAPLPSDLAGQGLEERDLSPLRLSRAEAPLNPMKAAS